MTRRETVFFSFVLVLLGAGWGVTIPLTKIAVSTGFGHFGLIFWQLLIGSVLMAVLCAVRGKGLPVNWSTLRVFAIVALIGTLIPNTASFQAAVHVPAGIMAILLSMIPMFAFPIALLLRLDSFSWRRLSGLFAGLLGVLIIVMPGVSAALAAPGVLAAGRNDRWSLLCHGRECGGQMGHCRSGCGTGPFRGITVGDSGHFARNPCIGAVHRPGRPEHNIGPCLDGGLGLRMCWSTQGMSGWLVGRDLCLLCRSAIWLRALRFCGPRSYLPKPTRLRFGQLWRLCLSACTLYSRGAKAGLLKPDRSATVTVRPAKHGALLH